MKTESEIILELQNANLALQAEKAALKDRVSELEAAIERFKAKQRPPENKPRPGITGVNFG